MRLPKSLRWFAIIILFIAALFLGLKDNQEAIFRQPEEVIATAPVTVPVTRGDVTQTVLAPGQLVSTRETLLSLSTGGELASVIVRPGSRVLMGDEIAVTTGKDTALLAPFDGVIVDVMARPGEILQSGQGVALLVDPAALEVRATVIEEDLPLIEIGQPAVLYFDAYPEASVSGRMVRIVPYRVPREDRPLYEVYLSLDGPIQGLAPGMTVDSTIIVAEVKAALRLPRGVLRIVEDGYARVRIWVDGEIQERTVQTGLRGNAYIEILSGLEEGDLVIGD